MRVVVFAAVLVLAACGTGGDLARPADGSTTSATDAATTTVDLRAAYFAELTALVDETERLIEETPETGNEGGYLTVATAYIGLSEAMGDLDPPPDLRVSHQALVAQARLIGEEAVAIAETPALSVDDDGRPVMSDRLASGLSLAEHRREFRELVADLAAR
jgi:predicted small lipoprotein YifL